MIDGADAEVGGDDGEVGDKQAPQNRNRQHLEGFLDGA